MTRSGRGRATPDSRVTGTEAGEPPGCLLELFLSTEVIVDTGKDAHGERRERGKGKKRGGRGGRRGTRPGL